MRPKLLFRVACRWQLAGPLLSACSGGGHHLHQDEATAARHSQASPVRPVAALPLLNLPAALGLRLRQFSARFGRPLPLPTGFLDPGKSVGDRVGAVDSLALFQPYGLPMIVSFSRRTGHIQDVLLLGPDEAVLRRQATLLPEAPRYVLLPVFQARNSEQLLGLRVIPK